MLTLLPFKHWTSFVSLTTRRLAYVSYEDICTVFQGSTLLSIQAPSGTQLEVPIPEIVSKKEKGFKIWLLSCVTISTWH